MDFPLRKKQKLQSSSSTATSSKKKDLLLHKIFVSIIIENIIHTKHAWIENEKYYALRIFVCAFLIIDMMLYLVLLN